MDADNIGMLEKNPLNGGEISLLPASLWYLYSNACRCAMDNKGAGLCVHDRQSLTSVGSSR